MSVKVTLEFATIDEAISALAKVRADSKDAPKAETAKVEKTEAAAPPRPAGATDKKKTPAPTPPAASSVPTGYGIVADKIATKAKTHRAEVVALLKKFGANSGKDLKAEQYETFVAEIDAIGAEAELA